MVNLVSDSEAEIVFSAFLVKSADAIFGLVWMTLYLWTWSTANNRWCALFLLLSTKNLSFSDNEQLICLCLTFFPCVIFCFLQKKNLPPTLMPLELMTWFGKLGFLSANWNNGLWAFVNSSAMNIRTIGWQVRRQKNVTLVRTGVAVFFSFINSESNFSESQHVWGV